MDCPFCSTELPSYIQASIEEIEACCPSDCDMICLIEAECPSCSKIFWSRWVETPHLWQIRNVPQFTRLSFNEWMERKREYAEVDWQWDEDEKVLRFLADENLFEAKLNYQAG